MDWTPDRMRSLRELLGYTQEEMAVALGFGSYQRVSELENAKRLPSKPVKRILEMLVESNSVDLSETNGKAA